MQYRSGRYLITLQPTVAHVSAMPWPQGRRVVFRSRADRGLLCAGDGASVRYLDPQRFARLCRLIRHVFRP